MRMIWVCTLRLQSYLINCNVPHITVKMHSDRSVRYNKNVFTLIMSVKVIKPR